MLDERLWHRLGLGDAVTLEVNSLGTPESRRAYRDALIAHFEPHVDRLDEHERHRLHENPLRLLDSKNPDLAEVIATAPSLVDSLDDESRHQFNWILAGLDAAGVDYRVNPRLVRGLDYYTGAVFEWVTDRLGAQGTVCAGGRYDGLVEQLGGRGTPAAGFALGIERLLALMEAEGQWPEPRPPHACLVVAGERAALEGLLVAERLREALPWLRLESLCGGGSLKSQFRRADRSGAAFALVMGDDEVAAGTVAIKPLRAEGAQESVPATELADRLAAVVAEQA